MEVNINAKKREKTRKKREKTREKREILLKVNWAE